MHRILDQLIEEMVDKDISFEDARREFEKQFIIRVVQKSRGNLSKAAEILGVHRNTLTRRLKSLKIKARPSGA